MAIYDAYLLGDATMDANASTELGPHLRHTRRRIDWFPLASVSTAALVDLTLMRYGIDLVPPLCVVALLAPSMRDALSDWRAGERYAGERDPIWAVCVLVVHLTATALALMWIFTTSTWTASRSFLDWLPDPMVRTLSVAEDYGWGRRAVLSGGRRPLWTAPVPASATAERSQSGSATEQGWTGLAGGGAVTSGSDAEHPQGTSAVTGPQPVEPASTATTLASAQTVSRAGAPIRLTAAVSTSGERPTGRVVFRAGTRVVGSTLLDTSGHAAVDVVALPPGEHTLVAEFAGNAAFRRSQSSPVNVRIVP